MGEGGPFNGLKGPDQWRLFGLNMADSRLVEINNEMTKPTETKVIAESPSSQRGCVAGPFMVRQAHHDRKWAHSKFNYLAVRPERVEGRTANYDTFSTGR